MARGRKRLSETVSDDANNDTSTGLVDMHVGARICARRKLLQLSQKQMAEKLGVTFQQIQKYEKGVNRIGAGRLYTIATILGVDVGYFFDELNLCAVKKDCPQLEGIGYLHEDEGRFPADPMKGAEAVMLMKAYYSLPVRARTALLTMLASLKSREMPEDDA